MRHGRKGVHSVAWVYSFWPRASNVFSCRFQVKSHEMGMGQNFVHLDDESNISTNFVWSFPFLAYITLYNLYILYSLITHVVPKPLTNSHDRSSGDAKLLHHGHLQWPYHAIALCIQVWPLTISNGIITPGTKITYPYGSKHCLRRYITP